MGQRQACAACLASSASRFHRSRLRDSQPRQNTQSEKTAINPHDNMAELKALKDAHWLKKDEVRKEEETLAAWEQQVGREDAALDAN